MQNPMRRSGVETLDAAIRSFLQHEINQEPCETGRIYRATQEAFPHARPEQIEHCAKEVAASMGPSPGSLR